MPESERDRRRYQRAPLRVEIYCENLPAGSNRGEGVICFYSTDISVGGLFLETDVSFQEGNIIHLRFHLPGLAEDFRIQGRVVRNAASPPHAAPGMAIEFIHLGYEDKKLIEGFVRNSEVPLEEDLG